MAACPGLSDLIGARKRAAEDDCDWWYRKKTEYTQNYYGPLGRYIRLQANLYPIFDKETILDDLAALQTEVIVFGAPTSERSDYESKLEQFVMRFEMLETRVDNAVKQYLDNRAPVAA